MYMKYILDNLYESPPLGMKNNLTGWVCVSMRCQSRPESRSSFYTTPTAKHTV